MQLGAALAGPGQQPCNLASCTHLHPLPLTHHASKQGMDGTRDQASLGCMHGQRHSETAATAYSPQRYPAVAPLSSLLSVLASSKRPLTSSSCWDPSTLGYICHAYITRSCTLLHVQVIMGRWCSFLCLLEFSAGSRLMNVIHVTVLLCSSLFFACRLNPQRRWKSCAPELSLLLSPLFTSPHPLFVPPASPQVDSAEVGAEEDEDLYTKLKTLQRQLEFLEIQEE